MNYTFVTFKGLYKISYASVKSEAEEGSQSRGAKFLRRNFSMVKIKSCEGLLGALAPSPPFRHLCMTK